MFTTTIAIEIPTQIVLGYNKKGKANKFSLNLNVYRNTHHHILAKAKVVYAEQIAEKVKLLPEMQKITKLKYTLFTGSRRKVDVMNVCCIVDKFLCDTLVSYGKIPEDNYDFIDNIEFSYGGISKNNPYVLVEITY